MICANEIKKSFVRTVKEGKKEKKEEFFAVNGISITAKEGEIVGVLGPNGAGKTTLLRMLGNLMEPTSGEVYLTDKEGNKITDPVTKKKSIGYLSGNTKLYQRFSVREIMMLLGQLNEISKEELETRIEKIISTLHMEEFADNRIERLSTGQTQRASIARCLIHDPDIYILDEPTLGLDILSSDTIVKFMKQQKELGKTVLYSTHYLEEAEFLCDRIVMIYKGEVVKSGSVKEILESTGTGSLREAFAKIMEEVDANESK